MEAIVPATVQLYTTCRKFGSDEWAVTIHHTVCEQHAAMARRPWRGLGLLERAAPEGAPCDTCATIAKQSAMWDAQEPKARAVMLSAEFSHTRFRNGFVDLYVLDSTSPTGVLHALGLPSDRYDRLAAELRGQVHGGSLSPLSPTEGR